MMKLRRTAKGDKLPSDLGIRLMALGFKLRDLLRPRKPILDEVGIRSGYQVLDFGCGPGSYVAAAAALVGNTGKVHVLDAHPLAIKIVQGIIAKKHITNVETILSEGMTGLPEDSVDVVLLYNTLHDFADPDFVLNEIYRTLKPDGILSLSDHHLSEFEIYSKVTKRGLFSLSKRGKNTYSFIKHQVWMASLGDRLECVGSAKFGEKADCR